MIRPLSFFFSLSTERRREEGARNDSSMHLRKINLLHAEIMNNFIIIIIFFRFEDQITFFSRRSVNMGRSMSSSQYYGKVHV